MILNLQKPFVCKLRSKTWPMMYCWAFSGSHTGTIWCKCLNNASRKVFLKNAAAWVTTFRCHVMWYFLHALVTCSIKVPLQMVPKCGYGGITLSQKKCDALIDKPLWFVRRVFTRALLSFTSIMGYGRVMMFPNVRGRLEFICIFWQCNLFAACIIPAGWACL